MWNGPHHHVPSTPASGVSSVCGPNRTTTARSSASTYATPTPRSAAHCRRGEGPRIRQPDRSARDRLSDRNCSTEGDFSTFPGRTRSYPKARTWSVRCRSGTSPRFRTYRHPEQRTTRDRMRFGSAHVLTESSPPHVFRPGRVTPPWRGNTECVTRSGPRLARQRGSLPWAVRPPPRRPTANPIRPGWSRFRLA